MSEEARPDNSFCLSTSTYGQLGAEQNKIPDRRPHRSYIHIWSLRNGWSATFGSLLSTLQPNMKVHLSTASIFFFSAICCRTAHPQNPLPHQGIFYPGTDLEFHMAETSKASSAAGIAEHVFSLPSSHLSPIYGYEEGQHQAVINHIENPASRYVVLKKYRRGWTFVISPWVVRRGPNAPTQKGVLFLQAYPGGVLSPIGYAEVKEGIPEGHSRDFWDTINRAARTTREELLRRFEIDRIVTPVTIRG